MDLLKYKDYEGTAELDMARHVCRGRILFIDDLVTYEAASPADLQAQFQAAVDDYIETCAQVGKEPQRPLKGMFNVRVPPELHRALTLRAVSDNHSLNEVVVRALRGHLAQEPQKEPAYRRFAFWITEDTAPVMGRALSSEATRSWMPVGPHAQQARH